MNKNTRKRIISALTLCAVSVSALMSTGCGKSKDDKMKIAVITKQNITFWEDVKKGAEDAGEELGAEILYNQGSEDEFPHGDNDYATQIEYINYAIDQDVDAIVIAPNGTTELNEAFARAEAAGIKILNINSRAQYGGILSCISSSDTDAGAVAARHAADAVLGNTKLREGMAALGTKLAAATTLTEDEQRQVKDGIKKLGKGTVCIVGHTAATAESRISGFKSQSAAQIAAQMSADGFALDKLGLSEADTADLFGKFFVEGERCQTVDAAYDEAKKLINANPDTICFFATNTNTTLGVCKAIEEFGLKDQIYVIGFNSDPQEISYLKDHVVDGLVIQNPYNMGYVGVRYALKAANDEGFPGAIDTGVTYITNDNLNEDYIQLLLKPENY